MARRKEESILKSHMKFSLRSVPNSPFFCVLQISGGRKTTASPSLLLAFPIVLGLCNLAFDSIDTVLLDSTANQDVECSQQPGEEGEDLNYL